jgi:uncharacterized coiled-coil DUF342 family protein
MPEPEDMVIPMLREMRDEMRERFDGVSKRFDGVSKRFDGVDQRLEKIESAQKSYRNALTADTMMSKFITGDFEERIEALEKKMDGLLKAPRA